MSENFNPYDLNEVAKVHKAHQPQPNKDLIINQLQSQLETCEEKNKGLIEQLAQKRPSNKCISSHCDNFIDHDYCEKCRRNWES